MNDKERISRLVGAAISECSSSRLDEVRKLLVRASRALGEMGEEKKKASVEPKQSLSGTRKNVAVASLEAIEDMIEREKSKSERESDGADLFG